MTIPVTISTEQIRAALSQLEVVEGVRIVFACESGSRAWGFPSADSDFDVRFIYVRPVEWYLSIRERRDVIERPLTDGLDINGWDLRKALQLLRKSNPPLLEWLGSPIVYLERFSVAAQMRKLAADCYSPIACGYHYLQMARGNFREFLQGERVWTKKYFYVLRPVLAVMWIEQGRGVVPTEFETLARTLVDDSQLRVAIERLLEAKRAGLELARGPRIPAISDFIEDQLARREYLQLSPGEFQPAPTALDELFRAALMEVWQAE